MRSVLVSEIVRRARQRADMENSQFVTDVEVRDLIATHYGELLDKLTEADPWQYSFSETESNTTANQEDYVLPTDFYRLLAVDIKSTSTDNWVEADRLHANDRNLFQNYTGWLSSGNGGLFIEQSNVHYRLMSSGSSDLIRFYPTPDTGNHQYRVAYMPHTPDTFADTDNIDGINGWEEYIVLLVAIDMLIKEESSTTTLERKLQRFEDRIERLSSDRDDHQPATISDVTDDRHGRLLRGKQNYWGR